MKQETLEKATALKREIDHLESIGQMLTDDYRKKNPEVHLGIARQEFSSHYLPLNMSDDLNNQLLEVVRKHIAEKVPVLQKELTEL